MVYSVSCLQPRISGCEQWRNRSSSRVGHQVQGCPGPEVHVRGWRPGHLWLLQVTLAFWGLGEAAPVPSWFLPLILPVTPFCYSGSLVPKLLRCEWHWARPAHCLAVSEAGRMTLSSARLLFQPQGVSSPEWWSVGQAHRAVTLRNSQGWGQNEAGGAQPTGSIKQGQELRCPQPHKVGEQILMVA